MLSSRTNKVPALDLTPSGHLPHLVDQADQPAFVNGEATPAAAQVFSDLAARIAPAIAAAPDPQAAYDTVMQTWNDVLTAAAPAAPAAGVCPVYRDCTVTEPGHYDHSGFDRAKVMDETGRGTLLGADMVAPSGSEKHAVVCVGVAEFSNLDALKAKTAELRRVLEEVGALGERVFTDHQARG